MKVWIETRLVKPPGHTVSGCFGCSVMFVGYCPWLREWRWLQPGGVQEKIPEPEKLFLEEDYVASNLLATPRGRRENPARIRSKKQGDQLVFSL